MARLVYDLDNAINPSVDCEHVVVQMEALDLLQLDLWPVCTRMLVFCLTFGAFTFHLKKTHAQSRI